MLRQRAWGRVFSHTCFHGGALRGFPLCTQTVRSYSGCIAWQEEGTAVATTTQQDRPVLKALPKDFAGRCGLYWQGNAAYEMWNATCATQEQVGVGNLCPVYACTRERGVAHCGVCSEFPCALLVNLAAQSGPGDERINSAALRAAVGDDQWAAWARERQIWHHAFCPLLQRGHHG